MIVILAPCKLFGRCHRFGETQSPSSGLISLWRRHRIPNWTKRGHVTKCDTPLAHRRRPSWRLWSRHRTPRLLYCRRRHCKSNQVKSSLPITFETTLRNWHRTSRRLLPRRRHRFPNYVSDRPSTRRHHVANCKTTVLLFNAVKMSNLKTFAVSLTKGSLYFVLGSKRSWSIRECTWDWLGASSSPGSSHTVFSSQQPGSISGQSVWYLWWIKRTVTSYFLISDSVLGWLLHAHTRVRCAVGSLTASRVTSPISFNTR